MDDDTQTLEELEIRHNCAVHVHIGRPRPQGVPEERGEEEVLDLSRLFIPLFGVILGICWVSLLLYPQVFSLMTKGFLFVLSLGYVYLAYVSL